MKRSLGMFSPEIARDTVERLFDAAKLYGFESMQFDFLSVCPDELPAKIAPALTARIRHAANRRGITISAVNGTFNMIHPDPAQVEDGIRRFSELAAACPDLDCRLVTLCTGTRNAESMWRPHPDNETPNAWDDLLRTLEKLLHIADRYGLCLGIETEASNVVNTPERARRLLDTVRSDRLKIIFDPANLFHAGMAHPENAEAVVTHAFSLLSRDIVLAHAKDIHAGDGISFTSAGRGIVPFERVFSLLDSIGYQGPVIAHGIHDEAEFPFSVAFLSAINR